MLRVRWFSILLAALLVSSSASAEESVCYGTSSHGRLEGGERIAESGSNFGPYSTLGVLLGRTYVHSKVAATIESAYSALASSGPAKTYLYGESGWEGGGRIEPHRTHQNGTAVDFMVPVLDRDGRSVPLPTGVTNKFGYSIEFDADARYENLTIDFEAMAEHLHALDVAARQRGIRIARVIFDPAYLPRLFQTSRGQWIKDGVPFMRSEPWIRHDEHYHVDFAVACRPRG